MILFDNKTQFTLGLTTMWLCGYISSVVMSNPNIPYWLGISFFLLTGCYVIVFYFWITQGFDLIVDLLEERRTRIELIDELQDWIWITGTIPHDKYPPKLAEVIKARIDKKTTENNRQIQEEVKPSATQA